MNKLEQLKKQREALVKQREAIPTFAGDKEVFEVRIQWVKDNLKDLESLAEAKPYWKEKPLYLKAVQTMRKVQKGIATGHMIGLDAVNSGKYMPL